MMPETDSRSSPWRASALVTALVVLATALAPGGANGAGLRRRSAAELRRAAAELEELSARPEAEAAAPEIELARQWIDDGLAALRERQNSRAALIAERLPVQLRLIRTILSAAEIEAEAVRLERAAAELEQRLDRARRRHDRMVLQRDGARLTGAFPRPERER